MTGNQIKIKTIKLKNLEDFARNALNDAAFRDVAPISLLRAASQSKNPLGEPDDIGLLVALYANRCVGYHGLLPGLLQNHERVSKIYWLVTFYLAADFRGRGYGKQLVLEILNTNVDLVTTGITQGAEAVYRSVGFRQLGELPFCRLRPQNSDFFSAAFQNLKSGERTFTWKPVNRLSSKLIAAPARPNAAVSFQRGINTVNWMIRNPWIVSRPQARQETGNYYFSRVRDLFKFIALEIFALDEKTRKGYLILSVSRKKHTTTLKVLDFYFYDPPDRFMAVYLALENAIKYRAERLEYPLELDAFFRDSTGLNHRPKIKKRLYLCYPRSHDSPLARLAGKVTLNYCDSDTAFT
jgi:GNAT superfamily N-acetyltransferase